MDSSRRKLAAILNALGASPSARRHTATPVAPTCESLEGRQLLSADAGLGMGMMGMDLGGPADFAGPGGGPGSMRGMGGQGGGFGTAIGQDFAAQGGSGQAVAAHSAHGTLAMDPGGPVGFGGPGGPGSMFADAGTSPGGSSTAATTPLQTDLDKLHTDIQAIHDRSMVTPVLEAAVRNDLKAIRTAATKTADATAEATLKTDLKTAWANPGGPTDPQFAQLLTDQAAVSKSEGVSDDLIARWKTDLQAIRTAAGVTDTDRATLAADQTLIETDRAALKTVAPTPTPTTPPPTSTAAPAATTAAVPATTSTPVPAAVTTPAPTMAPVVTAPTTPPATHPGLHTMHRGLRIAGQHGGGFGRGGHNRHS